MTTTAGRETVEEFGFTAHIKARGEAAQAIKKRAGYKARRWVVVNFPRNGGHPDNGV
jgi:hypothetical protein